MRQLIWSSVALIVGLGVLTGVALAGPGDYRVSDPSRVYLGNARIFQKPCHVSCDRVYRKIPEYREILEKGLTEKDVRYHFRMKKASARFKEAVKAMARGKGHDLVAEKGAVKKARKKAADVPDRTNEVIKKLG